MKKKYIVRLALEDRAHLHEIGRREPVRSFTWLRVQILLKTDRGPLGPGWSDGQIAEAFEVSRSTVVRLRKQFKREGLEACLERKSSPRPHKRRLDGASEARLIALACGPPPRGTSTLDSEIAEKRCQAPPRQSAKQRQPLAPLLGSPGRPRLRRLVHETGHSDLAIRLVNIVRCLFCTELHFVQNLATTTRISSSESRARLADA